MDYCSILHWTICFGIVLLAYALTILTRNNRSQQTIHKLALATVNLAFLLLLGWDTAIVFFLEFLVLLVFLFRLSRGPTNQKRNQLLPILLLTLLPLLFFKYRYLLGDGQFLHLRGRDSFWIPIGLSFYTFQLLGLMIDIQSGKCKCPSILDAFNFATFFPRFIAGPIERGNGLLPQMESFQFTWKLSNITDGIRYIVLGLFFKFCLGDNLALCNTPGITNNVFAVWLNNIAFGLRIYFDFSGYGFCAYGLARSLGVDLILNFKSPYTANNISDFWRRWHISLTKWFVDYIYIPLGGNRTNKWALNILIVFLVSGIWHGSSWNFIVWGLICGIALVVRSYWRRFIKCPIPNWVGLVLTWGVMFYAWMYFRETDVHALLTYNRLIVSPGEYTLQALRSFTQGATSQFVISCVMLPISGLVIVCEALGAKLKSDCHSLLLSTPALCVQIFLLFQFSAGTSNEFIYISF